MSKGRVPDVMDQPCTLKDVTHSRLVLRQEGIVLNIHPYALGYILPQGLGQGGDLKGMGKPGPDKIAAVQRKDLGLILKAAEGGASDNAVVIPVSYTHLIGGLVRNHIDLFVEQYVRDQNGSSPFPDAHWELYMAVRQKETEKACAILMDMLKV